MTGVVGGFVAVTGAAGKTGRAVAAALAARDITVRALVHRDDTAAAGVPGAAESIAVDMADETEVRAALTGAAGAYLIAPNMHPDEVAFLRPVIDACREIGPQPVVYHSVIHPYLPAMPHHRAKADVEALLHQSGLDWAIVQPASYFENALGAWDSIRETGSWPLPYAAEALFTPVALDDVAQVAASVLIDLIGAENTQDNTQANTRPEPRHRFATYELTGPETLTTADMARIAGQVLGREVTVKVDRDPDVAASRPPRLQAMFDYYHAHGICGNATIATTLLKQIGRDPTYWRDWVATHR